MPRARQVQRCTIRRDRPRARARRSRATNAKDDERRKKRCARSRCVHGLTRARERICSIVSGPSNPRSTTPRRSISDRRRQPERRVDASVLLRIVDPNRERDIERLRESRGALRRLTLIHADDDDAVFREFARRRFADPASRRGTADTTMPTDSSRRSCRDIVASETALPRSSCSVEDGRGLPDHSGRTRDRRTLRREKRYEDQQRDRYRCERSAASATRRFTSRPSDRDRLRLRRRSCRSATPRRATESRESALHVDARHRRRTRRAGSSVRARPGLQRASAGFTLYVCTKRSKARSKASGAKFDPRRTSRRTCSRVLSSSIGETASACPP